MVTWDWLKPTKITQVASCSLKYFNKPEIIQKYNTQNSSKIQIKSQQMILIITE